ncbi:MAG: tetratricopeptide repeat protein [Gemmatimonadetes bacterium]|jgi:tetratricopeptide (TPR) repeat protein|nr:tetratricopeptide repeat protein [Gemmatimonadota bacterium]
MTARVVAAEARLEEYQALEAALQSPDAVARRDALKAEIIALYRAIDRDVHTLEAIKGQVKELVQVWKRLEDGGEAGAPMATAPMPTPSREDHLNASTYIEKGWSLISLGDHAGAEAALSRALELAPNDPQALSLMGWTLMLREQYDEALLHFQRVLLKEPGNSLARINVGYICLKKRIFGEAIEHLSKAIRLDNDKKATLYAHYYLGLLYLEREMYEDAVGFFRKSLKLGPNLVEAWHELGRALWFGGDREGARAAWRDGAATNKFNPWAKRCAEVLSRVDAGGEPPR